MPNLPTVKAIAPKAASGASRVIMPIMPNSHRLIQHRVQLARFVSVQRSMSSTFSISARRR